jgi:tetratricopeptide (TPR) repeat protein
MKVASNLIVALTPSAAGVGKNLADFQDLAAHPSFAAQEIREQIVSFAVQVIQSSSVTNEEKQQAFSLAVTEMQKQISAYPLDAREHLELSYVYRAAGDGADALKEVQAAAVLSPKKEEIWIEAGVIEWDLGDVKATQTDFNTAYALAPEFLDLAPYAAAGNIAAGDTSAADKILIAAFGTANVDSDILAIAYYRAKQWPRLIALWKLRAAQPNAPVETLFSLAAAYYAAGDTANAIATINKAVALYPAAAASGAAAIAQIKGTAAGK